MKKLAVTVAVFAAVSLVGGTVSVLADSSLQTVEKTSNAGEYQVLNEMIKKNWTRLNKKQKEWYLKNPGADLYFPFGIDVDAQYPKGYPDCKEAGWAASYKPTAKLPEWCWFK